jgi:hypothetical protein
MEVSQEVVQVITDGIAGGLTDNKIMENMYTDCGVQFSDIKKVFNFVVVEHKLRMTSKDRNEKIATMMASVNVESGEHLKAIAESICTNLNITMKQCMVGIRGYAGTAGVVLPKIQRKPRGGVGFTKNYKILTDYVIQNKECTQEELLAYASEVLPKTKSNKDTSAFYANQVWNMVIFAKAFNS